MNIRHAFQLGFMLGCGVTAAIALAAVFTAAMFR